VRVGRLPETGRAGVARTLLSPTSADYTRGQATFPPLRAGAWDASLKPFETPNCTHRVPATPIFVASICYEYRSLKRFAQELGKRNA